MKKTSACAGIVAIILGAFYAPMFHVHTAAGEASLVHAHLPEIEKAEDDNGVHLESPHSHGPSRSIDILTTTTTPAIHLNTTVVSRPFVDDMTLQCCGFVAISAPRAHGPPIVEFRIPRAPPA